MNAMNALNRINDNDEDSDVSPFAHPSQDELRARDERRAAQVAVDAAWLAAVLPAKWPLSGRDLIIAGAAPMSYCRVNAHGGNMESREQTVSEIGVFEHPTHGRGALYSVRKAANFVFAASAGGTQRSDYFAFVPERA